MKRQCAICRISLLIVIRFKLIISILQKTQNKQQAQTNNACTFCRKNYKHNTSIQKNNYKHTIKQFRNNYKHKNRWRNHNYKHILLFNYKHIIIILDQLTLYM